MVCYVHRLGQAFCGGSCTTGIPSMARPTQKAKIAVSSLQLLCPLFLFLEKNDKGCTILSLATTNKHELFLKYRILSNSYVHCFSQMFFHVYIFPFCTDIILGMLPFLQGLGGGKGRRYGVLKMKTEFGVFLRSYKDQTLALPFQPLRKYSSLEALSVFTISLPFSLLSIALE